jgi:lipopolysaccharide/colanic/teichoic acid biosynthesis glycosyltransferase
LGGPNTEVRILLLMWLAGCSLAALSAALVSHAGGPWLLGVAALIAAQGALMAARAARLPGWAAWPAVVACVAIGALGFDGWEAAAYVALVALLLLLVDRFATLSVGLSTFVVPTTGAGIRTPGTMTLMSPVARELAHARREGWPLSVVSTSVPPGRGSSRRLAKLAQELVPSLRRSDVIVRALNDRLVVVMPRVRAGGASAVLARALAGHEGTVLIGIAAFPEDGLTWTALKEAAQLREQPWAPVSRSGGGGPADPLAPERERAVSEAPAATGKDEADRAAVLFELRSAGDGLRRVSDLAAVALAAPVVLPVIALCALAVKLDSPGPAFVRIKRVGRDGRPFGLMKLRSMTADAEARKEALRHMNTLAWPDFKIADDPRITRVGRVLRKYSLDELPQLMNVVRGEMTLVGPRPCSVRLVDYEPWQGERLEVTPGLAGRWQAEARGSADFATRCRLDILQAQGSIRADLVLVIATLRSVLRSRGAL